MDLQEVSDVAAASGLKAWEALAQDLRLAF